MIIIIFRSLINLLSYISRLFRLIYFYLLMDWGEIKIVKRSKRKTIPKKIEPKEYQLPNDLENLSDIA